MGTRWISKTKFKADGSMNKYQFIVKGYVQKQGIDYEELFSLIVKLRMIKAVLKKSTVWEWLAYLMDVKQAFLNG